jgi:hypothetical protein
MGEWMAHLLLPEVTLHRTAAHSPSLDGDSPIGAIEVKTSAISAPGEVPSNSFTLSERQRPSHALPSVFVAFDDLLLPSFEGREVVLPRDTIALLRSIRAILVVPGGAFPRPARTFSVPIAVSQYPHIRALQVVFRHSPLSLAALGLEGLSRLRALFDHPERAQVALRYIESMDPAISRDALEAYRQDPHRLLADADEFFRKDAGTGDLLPFPFDAGNAGAHRSPTSIRDRTIPHLPIRRGRRRRETEAAPSPQLALALT